MKLLNTMWEVCKYCIILSLQLLFTLTFWLLLRQSVKDTFSRRKRLNVPLQEVTTGGEAQLNLHTLMNHITESFQGMCGLLANMPLLGLICVVHIIIIRHPVVISI